MPDFTICVARKTLRIHSLYDRARTLCRDYLVPPETPADYCLSVTPAEIAAERSAPDTAGYSDGYLETLALYRKLCSVLSADRIFMMHGAVVAVGDAAYMFTAPSGTGKTTHIRLWLEQIPGSYVVNGDKPLLLVPEEGDVLVCGTPWCGKEGLNTNTVVPLRAVVLLRRGTTNEIAEVSAGEHFVPLLAQIHRPAEQEAAIRVQSLLPEFMNRVRVCQMFCTPEPQAALTARRFLQSL